MHIDGQSWTFDTAEERAARARAAAAPGDLTADMPGQVVSVAVAIGDAVTSGQTLMILEAMKMEIRVAAPTDGRVVAIGVAPGDVVDRGQTLIELAASDD